MAWWRCSGGNATLYATRKDGSRFPVSRLSYGQRRLLGLLWYLSLSGDCAIIDELANGLHYDLVEQIVDSLRGRQSFLAMQDPLVLDHLQFADVESVRQGFVLCEPVTDANGRERWRWSNLSAAAAADVYESWQMGMPHVHDILRTRGYW